jgi:hypothetical protein
MSVQDLAACNLNLRTAGRHTLILWDVSCHHINKKALLPVTWAQFMPFSFVLYALFHYYIRRGRGGASSTASIVEVLGLRLSDATATQVEGSAPGVTPFGNDAAATLLW